MLPAFVLAVVAGTLHHETGHYLAAKSMGLKASVHYDYTNVHAANDAEHISMKQMAEFIMAGPLQTMLTGTVTLLLLYIFDRQKKLAYFPQFFLIFITLFWVRQPINFGLGLWQYINKGQFPERGDEAKLSLYYHLPVWSLNAGTAILGLLVIIVVIFRFVPMQQRFTFWLASSIGGAAGYFLWIIWLGKYILP